MAAFVNCSSFQLSLIGEINHVPPEGRASFASGINTACRAMPALLGGFLSSSVVKTEPATAKVYLDTDTYGDKELKIAPRKYTRVGYQEIVHNKLLDGSVGVSLSDIAECQFC